MLFVACLVMMVPQPPWAKPDTFATEANWPKTTAKAASLGTVEVRHSCSHWPLRALQCALALGVTVLDWPTVPTIRGVPGPYRLFFYSFDCNEPMHVHVRRDRNVCKFWLEPVALA